MATSQIYNLDGSIESLNELLPNGKPFFRKMLNKCSRNEYHVARLLHIHPQPNVVNVYKVTPAYYDMEILEVIPDLHFIHRTVTTDIQSALDQLHSLGVVYVDLKFDNVGYSQENGCWKLFDFDGSGVINTPQEWLYEPPDYFTYKKYKQIAKYFEIDKYVFIEFCAHLRDYGFM